MQIIQKLSKYNNNHGIFETLTKLATKFRTELISYTQVGVRNVRFFPYEIFYGYYNFYERIFNISLKQHELLRVEKLDFHNVYGVS